MDGKSQPGSSTNLTNAFEYLQLESMLQYSQAYRYIMVGFQLTETMLGFHLWSLPHFSAPQFLCKSAHWLIGDGIEATMNL